MELYNYRKHSGEQSRLGKLKEHLRRNSDTYIFWGITLSSVVLPVGLFIYDYHRSNEEYERYKTEIMEIKRDLDTLEIKTEKVDK